MKKALFCLVSVGLLLSYFSGQAFGQNPVPRSQYLTYARSSAEWTWQHYDELVEKWKQTFDPKNIFGYRAPGGLVEMAVIFSYLFEKEKKPEYAKRAKKILITYGDFRSFYPEEAKKLRIDYEEAVPALPDFFTVMRYIRAYDTLRRLNSLSADENKIIEGIIAESIAYHLRTQEWGTMNRAMLRAESLAWAVRALPHDKDVKIWKMQAQALGDDNWGNWQIEDATIYNGVWLYSLLGYAEAQNRMEELFKTPEVYYYAHYYLHLMSPAGMIPDFGDANWESNWAHYLVFFEAAASHYQDPHLKWAASTIARKFIDFKNPTNIGLGFILLDCYRWANDHVAISPPPTLSEEVMEDVQGKKIVFRNGWDAKALYLLFNYRDEGDGGLNFRDYLRDTIPVEEEKMTHGHSDENSIILLMSRGSVLLHDAGYRDYMPSGPFGSYRQDYFHNRLCVRPEKIWMGQQAGEYRYSLREAVPGQSLLDFLRDAGSYRRVRTQKVDFLNLSDFAYSRTRLTDDNWGYEWDRVITFIKDINIFVVFDIFKSLKEEFFTLANLWHTRQIMAKGNHWYDTVYDRIQDKELPSSEHLLIVFPSTHFKLDGVEPQKRHYQDEWLIHQTTAQHFELRETIGLVTVLIPHPATDNPQNLAENVRLLSVESPKAGLGVKINAGEKKYYVAAKNDLRQDMARDWKRPKYTYESGKNLYGDFETNGDFIFACEDGTKLSYTIVNLTRALYQNKLLIEAKPWMSGLAFDGSPDAPERGKLRYWRDEVILK